MEVMNTWSRTGTLFWPETRFCQAVFILIVFSVPFLHSPDANSQYNGYLKLDSIPLTSMDLDGSWKTREGDDSSWASLSCNDQGWDTAELNSWPKNPAAIHWYRLKIRIDQRLLPQKPLALMISQAGASDWYLNGKKLGSFGVVSADKHAEEGYDPRNTPLIFNFSDDTLQVLSIRYSNHVSFRKTRPYGPEVSLAEAQAGLEETYALPALWLIFIDLTIGFFTGLTALHLFLFFFYRADRNNLYYSLFTGAAILLLSALHFNLYHTNSRAWLIVSYLLPAFFPLFFYSLFLLSRNLLDRKVRWYYYLTAGLTVITVISYFINTVVYSYLFVSLMFNVGFSTVFMIWHAYRAKRPGSVILGSGLLFAVGFLLLMLTLAIFNNLRISFTGVSAFVFVFFLMLAILSIPVSMSLYLARSFARTSRSLQDKLTEVERLSGQALAHAREKEELLAGQNTRLEEMVRARTLEVEQQKNKIEKQKEELEVRNREITDSLHYAHFLQQAILPHLSFIREQVQDCFVIYRPKDIVAGDFYFAETEGEYFFIAAADCTGHGVPGAMLSVMCSNALNQAVHESSLREPGAVLDKVQDLVSAYFEKSRQDIQDGMDISLLVFHRRTRQMQWAGANINLWYDNGTMREIKGDKQPIGRHHQRKPYTTHQVDLSGPAWLYLFTDGYADQFGGADGKKFMRRNLWNLLESFQGKNAGIQRLTLEQAFLEWSAGQEQVDDVTVIGIHV